MDHTLREWVRLGEKCGLAPAALDAQAKETRMDRTHIRQVMLAHWHDMQSAIRTGLEPGLRSVSGLSGGQAVKLLNRMQEGKSLCGTLLGKAEAYALATAERRTPARAKMLPRPQLGACGNLPGLLQALAEERNFQEDALVDALFVAAAVGESIASQASISGAEGGCQAECGSAVCHGSRGDGVSGRWNATAERGRGGIYNHEPAGAGM